MFNSTYLSLIELRERVTLFRRAQLNLRKMTLVWSQVFSKQKSCNSAVFRKVIWDETQKTPTKQLSLYLCVLHFLICLPCQFDFAQLKAKPDNFQWFFFGKSEDFEELFHAKIVWFKFAPKNAKSYSWFVLWGLLLVMLIF